MKMKRNILARATLVQCVLRNALHRDRQAVAACVQRNELMRIVSQNIFCP